MQIVRFYKLSAAIILALLVVILFLLLIYPSQLGPLEVERIEPAHTAIAGQLGAEYTFTAGCRGSFDTINWEIYHEGALIDTATATTRQYTYETVVADLGSTTIAAYCIKGDHATAAVTWLLEAVTENWPPIQIQPVSPTGAWNVSSGTTHELAARCFGAASTFHYEVYEGSELVDSKYGDRASKPAVFTVSTFRPVTYTVFGWCERGPVSSDILTWYFNVLEETYIEPKADRVRPAVANSTLAAGQIPFAITCASPESLGSWEAYNQDGLQAANADEPLNGRALEWSLEMTPGEWTVAAWCARGAYQSNNVVWQISV